MTLRTSRTLLHRVRHRIRERVSELPRDDRGSLSVAVVIWTPIVLVLCAFVVDVGFLISNREHANNLAEQAARRVADDLNQAMAHQYGGTMRVNVDDPTSNDPASTTRNGTCVTDAKDYFTATGTAVTDHVDLATIQCTVTNNPTTANLAAQARITVTLRMTYRPLFGGILVGDTATVEATGTASPISGG